MTEQLGWQRGGSIHPPGLFPPPCRDIPSLVDAVHAITHNKVMFSDGETVITGSFNFSKAAEEKNAENLLVIRDKALAERYIANWKLHAGHSELYKGRESKGKR